MTKIDIFSGFLGAGKTTLIQKLIKEGYQGEKIVLIENEFGEIGIDGGFLKEAGVEITEMNSGCICCSLVGDFKEALKQVLTDMQPDRILIEPSGVGKLSDVIAAVKGVEDETSAVLNHFVTVVDVMKCRMYMKNFGEFFNNQIAFAKTIILSRTQNVSEKKIEEAVAMIREKNSEARILTTPWDQLDATTIIEAMEASSLTLKDELFGEDDVCTCEHDHEHPHDHDCGCEHDHEHHHDHDCGCEHDHEHHHDHDCGCEHDHEHHHDHGCGCEHGHDHHHDHSCGCEHDHEHHHDHSCGCEHDHDHHHADDVFTTWGTQTTHVYSREKLETILEALNNSELYGHVLRAKGIVKGEDTWYYFDMVPGEKEIREGKPDYAGRLCVIGSQLDEKAIQSLFLGA